MNKKLDVNKVKALLWKNSYLAILMAANEIGDKIAEDLIQDEKRVFNEQNRKIKKMLSGFEKSIEKNQVFTELTDQYMQLAHGIVEHQMEMLDELMKESGELEKIE